jgi:hypothetical protein
LTLFSASLRPLFSGLFGVRATGIGTISPSLALEQNARYRIRKQACPLEPFLRPVSSAIGLMRQSSPKAIAGTAPEKLEVQVLLKPGDSA